jgi:hypothetical protein
MQFKNVQTPVFTDISSYQQKTKSLPTQLN